MSHPEVSPEDGPELKNPKASQVGMEPSNLQHRPLQNSSPTAGSKRRRSSSSSPESARKRQAPELATTTTPTPLKPPPPETNWHCPNCGTPCWGCFSRPDATPVVARLDEEEDFDQLRMNSAPPTPSQSAYTTRSSAPQDTGSSRNKKKRALDAGYTLLGPKDKGFQNFILDPLGVFIIGSQAEKVEPSQIFTTNSAVPDSRMIIDKDDGELENFRQDFKEYEARGYDEQTLSTICTDSIVLRDRFVNTTFVGEDQVIRKSVRREKWRPKKEGPSVTNGIYRCDWDIEPDTTYSVSMRMFDVKHRRELVQDTCYPWLAERFAVCPYLTIEYKCTQNGGKFSDAKYQITAAAVIWLFQRKRIRQLLGSTVSDLRHYAITFMDSTYTVWEARFQDELYHVQDLSRGDLTTLDGLKLYVQWSNAIHSWGLGANADSFKTDIETLLERRRSQHTFPTPASTNSQQLFSNPA